MKKKKVKQMVSLWPFGEGGDAGGGGGTRAAPSTPPPGSPAASGSVPGLRGLAETESFENMTTGAERDYGGSGVTISQFDRMRNEQKVRRHGDSRAVTMDVESIESLVGRFENEFRAADAHMKGRLEQQSYLQRYDYDNDRRYQQWTAEHEQMRERLHIHWLDTVVDEPLECLVYFLRVGTTAGLFYGAGRTAYLYRTMDKTYAKLNGVSIGRIAFNEITSSVARGSGVALAGTIGVSAGSATFNLVRMLASGDVCAPPRTWWNITSAGVFAGLFSGAAFIGFHHKSLTPWGKRAVASFFTAAGTAAGLYLGYGVYRPFAAQRTHGLYDPYWRPWQLRHERMGGPNTIRGKYM